MSGFVALAAYLAGRERFFGFEEKYDLRIRSIVAEGLYTRPLSRACPALLAACGVEGGPSGSSATSEPTAMPTPSNSVVGTWIIHGGDTVKNLRILNVAYLPYTAVRLTFEPNDKLTIVGSDGVLHRPTLMTWAMESDGKIKSTENAYIWGLKVRSGRPRVGSSGEPPGRPQI